MKPSIVVTNCTTRKARGPALRLDCSPSTEDIEALACRWKAQIEATEPTHLARDLYRGRSFSEAKKAASESSADLYIVSAGLGLVNSDRKVPNYDLSVTSGSEFAAILAAKGASAQQWWRVFTRADTSIRSLISDPRTESVMLALPASYLRLVHDDLNDTPKDQTQKLAIFTSVLGTREVPEKLAHCVAPYDERLESLPGFCGTRSEFPQRAMRHYVKVIQEPGKRRETAWSEIRQAMHQLPWRELPKRTPRSDAEIRELLMTHWEAHNGFASHLLRFLRNDLKVQCEQSRFRRIWRSILKEQQPA